MFCGSDQPTMAATVKAGHPAQQAGWIPKQFGRIPPARPDERDAGNSAGIQSRDARNRFALTEYRVVMVSRRRVVHLDVVGRFALVLRGTLLLARLLRLVWLLRVRGFRGGYRRCADRCRDGCGT
jgi:hypothetical protein